MIVGTVHHISGMDELIPRPFREQLQLRITKNNLPPVKKAEKQSKK